MVKNILIGFFFVDQSLALLVDLAVLFGTTAQMLQAMADELMHDDGGEFIRRSFDAEAANNHHELLEPALFNLEKIWKKSRYDH